MALFLRLSATFVFRFAYCLRSIPANRFLAIIRDRDRPVPGCRLRGEPDGRASDRRRATALAGFERRRAESLGSESIGTSC